MNIYSTLVDSNADELHSDEILCTAHVISQFSTYVRINGLLIGWQHIISNISICSILFSQIFFKHNLEFRHDNNDHVRPAAQKQNRRRDDRLGSTPFHTNNSYATTDEIEITIFEIK